MKTIAVIGLGPSGLVATKELKAKGFEVTSFDAQDSIGGIWAAPGKGHGVYRELCLNSARVFTEYSDFPWNKEDYPCDMPDEGGVFPSAVEYNLYLNAYARRFQLEHCFRLKTKVQSMERKDTGGYKITVKDANGKEETLEFDGVVVCTGIFTQPKDALYDVFKDFKGEVIHGGELKSTADYKGKRVLVVGASVSGSDATVQLACNGDCSKVVNSIRKIPYHIDKFSSIDNKCCDAYLFLRLVAWINGYLPESVGFEGLKKAILQNCPEQLTDDIVKTPTLKLDKDIRVASTAYTSGYVAAAKKGLFTIRPGVAKISENTVFFTDDTSEVIDVVILCTGYKGWNLELLPEDIRDQIKYVGPTTVVEPALFRRCLVPNVKDMALIGLPNIGAIGPAAEVLARYVSAIFKGDIPRPPEKKIVAGAERFRKHRDAGQHNKYDITPMIVEEVGAELGVTPTIFEALRNPSELLFGPMYPCYYRTKVDEPEVVDAAKRRLEMLKQQPQIYRENR